MKRLFIGGPLNGQILEIAVENLFYKHRSGTTGYVTYSKRQVRFGRPGRSFAEDFYFAVSSMTDGDALSGYLQFYDGQKSPASPSY